MPNFISQKGAQLKGLQNYFAVSICTTAVHSFQKILYAQQLFVVHCSVLFHLVCTADVTMKCTMKQTQYETNSKEMAV